MAKMKSTVIKVDRLDNNMGVFWLQLGFIIMVIPQTLMIGINYDSAVYEYGPADWDPFAFATEFFGSVFIGRGIEVNPAKRLSFFLQASLGYNLPISLSA